MKHAILLQERQRLARRSEGRRISVDKFAECRSQSSNSDAQVQSHRLLVGSRRRCPRLQSDNFSAQQRKLEKKITLIVIYVHGRVVHK